MGYTYGFCGRIEVSKDIYLKAMKYAAKGDYYSHVSKDEWEQFVSFDSDAGLIYLFREENYYHIGAKVCSKKRNEPRTIDDIIGDIDYIRSKVSFFFTDCLNEVNKEFLLKDVEIYLACAEYPFLT